MVALTKVREQPLFAGDSLVDALPTLSEVYRLPNGTRVVSTPALFYHDLPPPSGFEILQTGRLDEVDSVGRAAPSMIGFAFNNRLLFGGFGGEPSTTIGSLQPSSILLNPAYDDPAQENLTFLLLDAHRMLGSQNATLQANPAFVQAFRFGCHSGPMLNKQPDDPDLAGIGQFVDENFANVGIGDHPVQALNVTEKASDRFKFRSMTLRQLKDARTFFHSGSFTRVRDVVAYFNDGIPADETAGAEPTLDPRFTSPRGAGTRGLGLTGRCALSRPLDLGRRAQDRRIQQLVPAQVAVGTGPTMTRY